MDGARRFNKALQSAKTQGCDGLLIANEALRFYLTGFRASFGYLLMLPRSTTLYLDGRYIELAQEVLDADYFKIEPLLAEQIIAKIASENTATLGLDCAPASLGKKIQSQLENLVSCKQVDLSLLRQIKTADEIDLISEACVLTDDTFMLFKESIKLGMDETDLQFLWRRAMLEAGGLNIAFDPIIAINAGTSYPHYMLMRETRVAPESLILVDSGVEASGYKSDMTRMIMLPKVPVKIIECYEKVLTIQEQILSSIRPGKRIIDTALACEELLRQQGLEGRMMHALGHGVGMEVHEEPFYHKDGNEIWRENMVIAVEPGAYFPGDFGIRIEDTVVIKNDGILSLTRTPKDLQNTFLSVQ